MNENLQAAVYRVDITPLVGISMCGYLARDSVSSSVQQPLTATALVLANSNKKLVIVGCDLHLHL